MEALELRVTEGGGLAAATSAGVRLAERFRLGPALEVGVAAPHGVRGIEHMVLPLGPLEQVEGDEAWQLVQVALAAEPDDLELLRAVLQNLEPIHRDEHLSFSSFRD